MLERSLEILRPLNERHVLVAPILHLGQLMEVTGNYTRALALYGEGLETATAIGDRWFATSFLTALNGLIASTHISANPEHAHERLRSAVAEWRLIGDPRYTAFGLRLLSHSALALGRYDEARAVLEESAALNQSLGDRWGLGSSYRGLAIVAQALGQHQEAVVMFGKSLHILTELGGNWWVARVLTDMSRSVFALGNRREAWRVWRESLRIATEIHATPVALEALASWASLQAEPDHREHALELLLIVLHHPASLQETKNRADRLRAELEAQLTSTQIEAIQAHAGEKTLEAVVEDLLR
jgi:tetratricopeptide (TPR) repeat protein